MNGNNTILVTKQGLTQLKKERDELENVKRPQAVERLAAARAQGDLTENSEYTSAKQDLSFIDGRIAELDLVLHEAKVVTATSKRSVNVGCKVTIENKGKEETFTIVGEWEADPAEKKISHSSPLGKALLGKKNGESVEVEAPAGKLKYQILKIH